MKVKLDFVTREYGLGISIMPIWYTTDKLSEVSIYFILLVVCLSISFRFDP